MAKRDGIISRQRIVYVLILAITIVFVGVIFEKVYADRSGTLYQVAAKQYLVQARKIVSTSQSVVAANTAFSALNPPRLGTAFAAEAYSRSYKKALQDSQAVSLIRGGVAAELHEYTRLIQFQSTLEKQLVTLHTVQQDNPQEIVLTHDWIETYKPVIASMQASVRTAQVPPVAQNAKAELGASYKTVNSALANLDDAVAVGTVANYYAASDQLTSVEQQLESAASQLKLFNPNVVLSITEVEITHVQNQL